MARTIIVGDGPAGLSAALFLAKNGLDVTVYAQDRTAMHYALLHNYLGLAEISGSDFQRVARDQVSRHGGQLREIEVVAAAGDDGAFTVRAGDGTADRADYLVLAGGKAAGRLADQLGAERRDGAVVVDTEYRTTVDRLYAVGRLARPERSQAIISAGAGATVAVDILSREAGRDVHDWDTPPERS